MGKYYKILLISVGLLLGIILGGLIVYFALGGSVKNIYVFNQPAKEKEGELKKELNAEENKEKKEKAPSQVVIKYLKKDDTAKDEEPEDVKQQESDTTAKSLNNQQVKTSNEDEEIIVRKDELLFSEMLMIINLDTIKTNTGDSLAKLAANIKEPAINQFYQVEYWKSPLNYRGYKFSKNKLVVYGIEYIDKGSIYRWKENFYFKANGRVYALEKTPEFRPYEITNNPDLLRLIEKKSNAN
jgi:hypothetical protein